MPRSSTFTCTTSLLIEINRAESPMEPLPKTEQLLSSIANGCRWLLRPAKSVSGFLGGLKGNGLTREIERAVQFVVGNLRGNHQGHGLSTGIDRNRERQIVAL